MPDDVKAIRTANIYQRMNAVQQEIDYVQKEKKQGMRYSIVSHDAVTAAVRPLMVKHGILYYPTEFQMQQHGTRTQLQCLVVFQNIDDPADYMQVATAGFGIDEQDKGPGKAISYAVKYALLKALGLESGDDPDNDQDVMNKPGITDPRRAQVEEFRALIAGASDMDRLNTIRTEFKPVLDDLRAEYPAFVQEAASKWQQKAAAMKKTTA
jgi:hypothetical protein